MGHFTETPFCFVTGNAPNSNFSMQFPLLYIPFGSLACASSGILCVVGIKITLHVLSMHTSMDVEMRSTVIAALRIFTLSFIILGYCFWLVAFKIITMGEVDSNMTVLAWVVCRLKHLWNFPNPGACPDHLILTPFSYQLGNLIWLSSLGTINFCIFVFDKKLFIHWRNVYIQLSKHFRWMNFLAHNSTSFSQQL